MTVEYSAHQLTFFFGFICIYNVIQHTIDDVIVSSHILEDRAPQERQKLATRYLTPNPLAAGTMRYNSSTQTNYCLLEKVSSSNLQSTSHVGMKVMKETKMAC